MLRSSPVPFHRFVLTTLLGLSTALGQSHLPASKAAHTVPVVGYSDQALSNLLGARDKSIQSGDAAAIAEASQALSACLYQELAKLRLAQGRTSEAVKLYRSSLELHSSSEARLELASTLLRAGEPQEAARETSIVVEAEPQSASAWAVRGSALRSAGDEKEAVHALSRSLELRPDVNVAYALASALLARRQKAEADQILRQILTGSKNAPIWHVAVGDAYREALYLTDAVEQFKKAIAIDPRVGHAEFFLGLTYLQMNQWGPNSQSFEHLRAAVRYTPRDYVSNFYLGALESTDGSDLAASNRHLHAAADVNPDSPEVWLYLGLNAAREKNTADAKTYLRKAIKLTGPNDDRNNYQIRRVYAVLGRILVSEGNHLEGDPLLERYKRTAQQALENSAEVIAHSAAADLEQSAASGAATAKASFPGMNSPLLLHQPESTAVLPSGTPADKRSPKESRQIAALEPQLGALLASSLNDLGTAEARQGHYESALKHFEEAEPWQPPTPVLLHNLGVAAFRVGDFKESARALGLYLKPEVNSAANTPHDDRAHMMLAMSLFSMGKFAEADAAFTPIQAATLKDPRAAYSWAYSLAHSGHQPHANQIADELNQQQLQQDVTSLVCHIYMDTENYEQSAACYRKASQAYPALVLAHYQVAESLIRLDRPAEAVPELRQELVLSPDDPDVQYLLAFALLQSSHRDEAMTILEDLTARHPTHAQAQYQLGKTLLELGRAPDAVRHLELAEQIDPGPDYIHYQLQSAYRKVGRTSDADRELAIYRDSKAKNREITSPH